MLYKATCYRKETHRYLLIPAVPNSRTSSLLTNHSLLSLVKRWFLHNVPNLEMSLICIFGTMRTSAYIHMQAKQMFIFQNINKRAIAYNPSLRLSPSATSDIISHMTIGLRICGFLLVVNFNQPSVSNGFWDIKIQRYWGHDLALSGSRGVTIELAMCGFILVVHMSRPCISHGA